MGGEWRISKVLDVADKTFSGPFGSNIKSTEYVEFGVPVIRGLNLSGPRFHDKDYVFVTEKKAGFLSSSVALPGDIVFVARGTVGLVGIVPNTHDLYVLSPNLVGLRVNSCIADPEYIFYYFRSQYGQSEIHSYVSTTGVPKIARALESLRNFIISLPPLPEQRAIARILGTLDDKIELNRRMNETLEAMAQTLFKSWFVDFDPVVVNALRAGKPIPEKFADRAAWYGQKIFRPNEALGLPEDILRLFPDRFVDSELGPIPEGWEVKAIGELVKCVGGATPSTKNSEYWEGGKNPFLTPRDMATLDAPVVLDTERHITDAGVEKISSKQLPQGTVLLSSRAPIGYLAINQVPVSINQGIIAMLCNEVPNLYIYFWVKQNMDLIKSKGGGTTFAEISKRNFRPIPALYPSNLVLEIFATMFEPILDLIIGNVVSSRTIIALRDTLLPKLISGELRVPDVEKILEEAGI